MFLEFLNLTVFAAILVTLIYKGWLFVKYRKRIKHNTSAAITCRFIIADSVDLIVVFVFAINSAMRTLVGIDEAQWNTVSAEMGITLRAIMVIVSFNASRFADVRCERETEDVGALMRKAQDVLGK